MATITKTIKPSGGDYTSLAAWEAGRQADLVTAGNIEVAECYAMEDTTAVTIDGWTTNATNYIEIKGADSDKTSTNTGKWSTERYRLVVTGGVGLITSEECTRVHDLQVSAINAEATIGTYAIYNSTSRLYFYNNVLKGLTDNSRLGAALFMYQTGDDGALVHIYNNIILNCSGTSSYGIWTDVNRNIPHYIYNNTFVNCTIGMYEAGVVFYVKNNLFYNCGVDTSSIGTASNCGYNATTNSGLGYTAQTGDRVSQTFTFVNAGAGDYHLASNDAGAKDYGTSDPGSGMFSDDIDGETRSGSWDIGADEYVSSGGGSTPIPVFMTQYRQRSM